MNLTSIRADIRYLIFGNNANTTYGDTDLDRNVNSWYKRVLGWILAANGDWQVNGDFATTNIVAGQREYILPTDILKLNEVYIKSTADGDYVKANQRDILNVENYPEDYYPAIPEFDLMDNSLFIYIPDASITAVTDGIKIYYQTELTELSAGSDVPNIADIFIRAIVYGAAIDYCLANEKWDKAKKLENRLYGDGTVRNDKGIKDELMEFYATRSITKQPNIKAKKKNYI